jgi:hypothetical protein
MKRAKMAQNIMQNVLHTFTFFEYVQAQNAYFRKFIYFFILVTVNIHAGQHGMTLPHIEDEEGGLQTWRAATDILNKQSVASDTGWYSGNNNAFQRAIIRIL